MRKVNKPLTYLVHPLLMDTVEVKERIEKGHRINTLPIMEGDYDMIIGPNCFRLSPETINLLPLAEKAARDMKYPPKPKVVK